MNFAQRSLFDLGEPRLDPRMPHLVRRTLSEDAWIEHLPRWIEGHQAVFDALLEDMKWNGQQRVMYERTVDVPRLLSSVPADGPGHPILFQAAQLLSERHGISLVRMSMALYRDGQDSVALHGDKLARTGPDTVVAILSFGEPRKFVMRPAVGGAPLVFHLGWGDLLVMGGSCQRTWLHGVPKVSRAAPRISVQLRPSLAEEAMDPYE